MTHPPFPHRLHRLPVIRHARTRPRLTLSALIGVLTLILLDMVTAWRVQTRLLVAWNVGSVLYLGLAWTMMARASLDKMRNRAKLQDEGQTTILVMTVLAATASLVAIVAELTVVKDLTGFSKAAHIGLAALTLASAWAFTHTMFALHYAHEYYNAIGRGHAACLEFPGQDKPIYSDFLYFAFVVGTSGQTADVAMASTRVRRIGLLHCVLAFVFNTTILALMVNIGAGLI